MPKLTTIIIVLLILVVIGLYIAPQLTKHAISATGNAVLDLGKKGLDKSFETLEEHNVTEKVKENLDKLKD